MSAFAPIQSQQKLQPCVACFIAAGILPVSSIALHCAGIISLINCLFFLIVPTFGVALLFGTINRSVLKLALQGWVSGIVAVALYDISRIPFILAGWADFIPHISAWLTDTNENSYLIGYAWRYAGNGGGLGIVFFLLASHFNLRKQIVSNGVTFGLLVFAGLVTLLIIFPNSQDMMFRITPLSFFGGMTGHIVYGYALGRMANYLLRKSQLKSNNNKFPAAVFSGKEII